MDRRQQLVLAVLGLTVAVAAVVAVAVGQGRGDTTVSATSRPTSDLADTTTTVPSSTSSVSTTRPTGSTSSSRSTPLTTTGDPESTTTTIDLVTELVGPVFSGGTFVQLTELDPDQECPPSRLAFDSGEEIVHVYDDLGDIGGLRQFEGPYGVIALVENCEEVTTRVLFAQTATIEQGSVPPVQAFDLVSPEVFHLDDFGWLSLSGWFSADATFYDGDVGWNETIVIDPFDGSIEIWPDLFGSRDRMPVAGVDFVVPHNWNYAPITDDPMATMWALESASWVEITVLDGFASAGVIGPRDDETVLPVRTFEVDLWEEIDHQRARVSGYAGAREYVFIGTDGVRTVRIIELEDRTVRIEGFQDSGTGQAYVDEVVFTLDLVRVFEAVG